MEVGSVGGSWRPDPPDKSRRSEVRNDARDAKDVRVKVEATFDGLTERVTLPDGRPHKTAPMKPGASRSAASM